MENTQKLTVEKMPFGTHHSHRSPPTPRAPRPLLFALSSPCKTHEGNIEPKWSEKRSKVKTCQLEKTTHFWLGNYVRSKLSQTPHSKSTEDCWVLSLMVKFGWHSKITTIRYCYYHRFTQHQSSQKPPCAFSILFIFSKIEAEKYRQTSGARRNNWKKG